MMARDDKLEPFFFLQQFLLHKDASGSRLTVLRARLLFSMLLLSCGFRLLLAHVGQGSEDGSGASVHYLAEV
jgi:hypothetical protein